MSLYNVTNPLPVILSQTGSGLNGGKVYIGQPNQDPQAFPKAVYWDAAGTDPVNQASGIPTVGGYLLRAGAPASIYVDGDFSVRVLDRFGALVYYVPQTNNLAAVLSANSGSSLIGFIQSGTGAVARTVQSKERDAVSVKDFGATGDGVTNDNAAMVAAEAAFGSVYWPAGTYILNAVPNIAKSWGPGVCMVGGNRVYLRPTPEPATEIYAEIFGLANNGVTSDSTPLQRAIDFAQSLRLPVVLPAEGSVYLSIGLTMKHGQAAAGDTFNYMPLIHFNGCTIKPGPGIRALDIVPRCLFADRATGRGSAYTEILGPVTFDGSSGDASSSAIRIGAMGYYSDAFPFSRVEDILMHLFNGASTVMELVETRHLRFERVVARVGKVKISASAAGSFCGDMVFDCCEFTGSGSWVPLQIRSDYNSTGSASACRGIRFQGSTFYGPNASIEAVGKADVGDIWFDSHQFEGPYDATLGGRGLDIIGDGANARVFGVFLNNAYWSGHKGPAVYARALNGADVRAIHITAPDLAAFTISAATAFDANCNAAFAFKSVHGVRIDGGALNSIIGDSNTLVVNIQDSTNVSAIGLSGDNFTNVNAGVIGGGTTDKMTAIGNMLQVTSANVAANFGSGTQNIIANNLKVT